MAGISNVPGLAGYQQQVQFNENQDAGQLMKLSQMMQMARQAQEMQDRPEELAFRRQSRQAQSENWQAEAGERQARTKKMQDQMQLVQQIAGMPPDHPDRPALIQRWQMIQNPAAAFAPPQMPKMRERIEGGRIIQEEFQPDGTFKPVGSGERFAKQIAPVVNIGEASKKPAKLPGVALKMQQEELDAIGTASSIQADLASVMGQLEGGDLKLSLAGNLEAQGRNFLGASNPNSRNFASFKSTMEKMRNDSLRLNKGVQTEGDSVRAWNELFANLNDQGVVKQRLAEIQKINERATSLRAMNIDKIRGNYGAEPLDLTPYMTQPAAIGNGAKPAAGNKNITVDW